jgi:hypothetical protein
VPRTRPDWIAELLADAAAARAAGGVLPHTRVANLGELTLDDVQALGGLLVYVGRPVRRSRHPCARQGSPWGNPHCRTLAEYRDHVLARPDLVAMLPGLRGKVLAC